MLCLCVSVGGTTKDYKTTKTHVNHDAHIVMQASLQSYAIEHNGHSGVRWKDWTTFKSFFELCVVQFGARSRLNVENRAHKLIAPVTWYLQSATG